MPNPMQTLYRRFVMRKANKKGSFTDYCGVRITSVGAGEAEAELKVEKHHLNPYRVVHGGVYVTMMDQVAGCVSVSCGAAGLTVSSEMRYMASAREGTLYCHGKALRMGQNLAVVETVVTTDTGLTVAEGTYTFRLKPLKKA